MILSRGEATLEFFPYPDLDPYQSAFSCCIRLDDLGSMMRQVEASGVPDTRQGIPRYHPLADKPWGMAELALIDLNGNLIRAGQEN